MAVRISRRRLVYRRFAPLVADSPICGYRIKDSRTLNFGREPSSTASAGSQPFSLKCAPMEHLMFIQTDLSVERLKTIK